MSSTVSDKAFQNRPSGVLLCDPRYFDVIDMKNPFMEQRANVDKARAREQWTAMADAFRSVGAQVMIVPPVPECEDMVFCANTALTGVDAHGVKRAVVSHMSYPSRRREVEPTVAALQELGYASQRLAGPWRFEGGGDAIWHVGRRRIFGGFGYRSEVSAYELVRETFECEVVPLSLRSPQFYHLDTCLCVVDEETALVYPPALSEDSYAKLSECFSDIIEVDGDEALLFACNACSFAGNVIIERAAVRTIGKLRERGFNVLPIDTSEFMKSGGSVYCMKQYLF